MAFEDGAFVRNARFNADLAIGKIQFDDPVDELKIFETHVSGASARDHRNSDVTTYHSFVR